MAALKFVWRRTRTTSILRSSLSRTASLDFRQWPVNRVRFVTAEVEVSRRCVIPSPSDMSSRRPVMSGLPVMNLWQYGTKSCRLSSPSDPAPYWVVVTDGDRPFTQRSFDTYDAAIAYAV